SLRGEDADFDLAALTRDTLGRRCNVQRPAESLVLLKATASVPHEGGRRFGPDSPEYAILSRWITDGAQPDPSETPVLRRIEVTPAQEVLVEPADHVQISVRATFSDGSTRDVTRLAVYDPSNMVAVVTPGGEVRKQQDGETTILVRY